MDDGWLTTRNKSKIQPKQPKSKYRTSLTKQNASSSPVSHFLLTQNSPPPKQLFSATKQSSLTQFFRPAGCYDDMQEIPYQPENDESGGETKHKSSSEHSNPQLKNDNDGPDVISKENNPIMSRYIRGVSNEDKQESISKLEFQNERRRTKRKRASGTDISDSDSDDVEHRSSTTCTPDEILKVRSRHHKRLKHSPENTKVGENKITDVSRISSESTVSSLVCEISPVEDRNEIFKCDRFDPENTTQVSVNTKSKSKYHKHLSKDSFQPVNSDGTKDTLGRLTFLHDSPSIDLSVDAADSLDLDNEFTLRSQKEKYDALERVYQQDGLEPTELSLSDEFTCESQSIGNI